MTKGTATRSATDIANQIESLGGTIASSADWDGSSVTVTIKSDQLAPALGILADVTRNPAFAADEIERARAQAIDAANVQMRSEEHTSELQSLMRISYAVFWLKKKKKK